MGGYILVVNHIVIEDTHLPYFGEIINVVLFPHIIIFKENS
jgi:hypothetical protein